MDLLFDGTMSQLLNSMHANIRLTQAVSDVSVDFLDMTIYKGEVFRARSLFDIVTFQKLMNAYLYIPLFSHHNAAVFVSFIQSELRRYARNTTCAVRLQHLRDSFRTRLLDRGYSSQYLDVVMNVSYARSDILFPQSVLHLYGSRYHQYHPRCASQYPFNPPVPHRVYTMSRELHVFKIPYTDTYTTRVLADLLAYNNPQHSLAHDHMLRIGDNNQQHPIICYNRTQSIGDLLISAKHVYEFPF